jgi:UDP-N-acetylmuramate--alanine ligase
VLNALAAVAVGLELDIPFDRIAAGLAGFSGVNRRFQKIGEGRGVIVIDDYAHHPTEVRATLDAASQAWPDRRIVAVFQPHLYSRTQDCKDDFARAFFDADILVVADIFGAREAPVPGLTGEVIADLAAQYGHRHVKYAGDLEALPGIVHDLTREGDVVITMGAGNIWRYGLRILDLLQA